MANSTPNIQQNLSIVTKSWHIIFLRELLGILLMPISKLSVPMGMKRVMLLVWHYDIPVKGA